MIFSKKIIIIIAIIVAVVGGVVYFTLDTKDPITDPITELEQAYEEFDKAKSWEEAEKIDEKIQRLRAKIAPAELEKFDDIGTRDLKNEHPGHKIDIKSTW